MKNVRVKINSSGARALLRSPEVVADLSARGDRVLSQAEALAPVASGRFRDSLDRIVQVRNDRAVVRVGSDLDYARVIEANHGVLVRSLGGGS